MTDDVSSDDRSPRNLVDLIYDIEFEVMTRGEHQSMGLDIVRDLARVVREQQVQIEKMRRSLDGLNRRPR